MTKETKRKEFQTETAETIEDRARKEFKWDVLDACCCFKATKTQCAHILGVSEDTIERRIKERYGSEMTFTEYSAPMEGTIKMKLTQNALQMAFSGNTVMTIFCLKNLCGWKDKMEMEHSDKDGSGSRVLKLAYALPEKKVIRDVTHEEN